MARISLTTSPAGPVEEPVPSISPPRSLITTLAPSRAKSRACSRPMPRPAPVMTTTRPSQIPTLLSSFGVWSVTGRGGPVLLTQLSLEDLPSILPRQLGDEIDAARALVVREMGAAVFHQLGRQRLGALDALRRLHDGLDRLAPL